MKTVDRVALWAIAAALVTLAWSSVRTPAEAYQGLSRHDIAAIVRDALREAPFATKSDVRAAIDETLRRCTVKGRMTKAGDTDRGTDDAVDFVAYVQC